MTSTLSNSSQTHNVYKFKNIESFKEKTIKSIDNFFFASDSMLLFTIILFFLTIGIGGTFLFEHGLDNYLKSQYMNNILGAITAIVFLFIIYKFMDSKTTILGKTIDTGFTVYFIIIVFVLVIFSQ